MNLNETESIIGSVVVVELIGQSKGFYSFIEHLKWLPVIALGYETSTYVHLLLIKKFIYGLY
jgi:hypothetical protein